MSVLVVAMAASVQAVPTVVNVTVDDITKAGARLAWASDGPVAQPTKVNVFYGPTSVYGSTASYTHYIGGSTGQWYVSGMAADTLVHYCVQLVDASGATVCDGTRNNRTFRTAPEKSSDAERPEAPRQTVDTSLPTQNGKVWTVANDCSNLQASIDGASLGDTIQIPAGSVCTGSYLFPKKTTGSGWIVVRTSTPDSTLPAPGQRIKPADRPKLATLRNNKIWFGTTPLYQRRNFCAPGEFWQDEDELKAGGWGMFGCTESGTWTPAPYTAGTRVPSQCVEGDWFLKTDTADPYARDWLCVQEEPTASPRFVLMSLATYGAYENGAGLLFAEGAHHYRFIGLEITNVRAPKSWRGGIAPGMTFSELVYTRPTNHHLIFDRLYIHGQGFPSKFNYGLWLDGQNVAVIDSYIDDIHNGFSPGWVNTPVAQGYESYACAIQMNEGGPCKFLNNFISGVGITFYVTSDKTNGMLNDCEVVGNYFFKDDKYRYGSPTSDGRHYFNRHLFEIKRGRRWRIEGNVLEGNWAFINQGAIMGIGTRPDATPNSIVGTSDILVRSNIFKRGPVAYMTMGHNDGSVQPSVTQRIAIENNLFLDIDGKYVSGLSAYKPPMSGNIFTFILSPEDLIIRHNTAYHNRGQVPSFLITDMAAPGANLDLRDNIVWFDTPVSGIQTEGTFFGEKSLRRYWTRQPGIGWRYEGNLHVGTAGSQFGTYPAGNLSAASEDEVGFADPARGNFSLSGSRFKGLASDGTDPGVDWSALMLATAHTLDGNSNVLSSLALALPPLKPRVYPNPWRSDRHSNNPVITFDHLNSGSEVKIFTVSGHRVRSLPKADSEVTWDLRNSSGERVASGLYLYSVKDAAGQTARGKLAVVR